MQTRADFLGVWQLNRHIDDRHGHQQGLFQGRAIFHENGPDQLDYIEEGQIQFGSGPVLTANRRYQWHFMDTHIEVRFENGDAFHSFVAAGQADGTEHPCGDDHYTVRYDFKNWPQWQATWQVTGPRKDYTSITQYRR